MTQFIPPSKDKKKKDKDEEGGEEDDVRWTCLHEYTIQTLAVTSTSVMHAEPYFLTCTALCHSD